MMQQYMKELEQEPFDPQEFVERLAWRTIDVDNGSSTFEPSLMFDTFCQTIKDLRLLQDRQRKKCDKLEVICQEEENSHWQDIGKFQEKNKSAVALFHDLDEKINFVATKVIHLGDQLENINIPRARAVEAQKLMTYFAEFLADGCVEMFNKDSTDEELFEAADVIQKLQVIAQDLPGGPRFAEAKKKIGNKYDELERSLIEKFVQAQRMENVNLMREIATILSNFRSYSVCINAYIEESQLGTFVGKDIFKEALPLTEKNFALIQEVFTSPEQVMSKFVLNVYKCKLQNYIECTLNASKSETDKDKYLTNLNDLYLRTIQLSKDLSHFKLGSEDSYLSKLTHTVFQQYLNSYIGQERQWVSDKCSRILKKFYDSKAHQKKQVPSGGLQEIRREMQALVGTRANINIAQIEDYGGETFLSEEVCIAILEEAKTAFGRCQVLSRQSELANNASQIVEVLLDCLVNSFVNYALEIGLQAVPIPETKSQPQDIHFFKVIRQTNMIVYLIEKNFSDFAMPLLVSSPKQGEFLLRKKMSFQALEQKLENVDCVQNELSEQNFSTLFPLMYLCNRSGKIFLQHPLKNFSFSAWKELSNFKKKTLLSRLVTWVHYLSGYHRK
ncbi:unnamed protein product [Nesidiocoris tenuis]|uniref:Exocyst complex component 5 n=1 Tax=Nesidiocoris tenuis TaxID=355587 RepID=A0A6H5GHG1_9HEMI|nr:unnamed protein product [Nesidiocoris tenuis]